MFDRIDKGLEEMVHSSSSTPDMESSDGNTITISNTHMKIKTCLDCGTSKTPLWRGGPAGPKSLCNACGIKSRKRRALLGLNKEDKKIKKSSTKSSSTSHQSSSSTGSSGCSTVKNKFWTFSNVRPRSPRSNTPQRKKLGEVEQAAFLLMSLSYGSVFA